MVVIAVASSIAVITFAVTMELRLLRPLNSAITVPITFLILATTIPITPSFTCVVVLQKC